MIRALLSSLQSIFNSILNREPAPVYTRAATRSLAVALSAAMIGSSVAAPVHAGLAASAPLPEFVRTLTPPSRLGYLENYFQGNTKKPVVLIQDLHCNYGVQKNIMGLLKFLEPKVTSANQPMVVGVEATWQDTNLDYAKKYSSKVRERVGDYFLKEGEMTGMQAFAMNSDRPVQLKGIDDRKEYLVHRALIRKSVTVRMRLAHKLDELHAVVSTSKNQATKEIKKIWKIEASFEKGELGLPDLAKALGVAKIENYGQAEAIILQKKLELAEKAGDKALFLKNLVKADQNLRLLSRLFRQQMTLEEVKFITKQIPEMLVVIQSILPQENMAEWHEAIRSAIDYYAIALLRDKPMAEKTIALAQKNAAISVVAVSGGFHTTGISKILRDRKISYVVLAPVVESHTTYDEVLYLRRMLGDHESMAEIAAALKNSYQASTSMHTAGIPGAPVENQQAVIGALDAEAAVESGVERTAEGENKGIDMPLPLPEGTVSAVLGADRLPSMAIQNGRVVVTAQNAELAAKLQSSLDAALGAWGMGAVNFDDVTIEWDSNMKNGENFRVTSDGRKILKLNPRIIGLDDVTLGMHMLKAVANAKIQSALPKGTKKIDAERMSMRQFIVGLAGAEVGAPLTLQAVRDAARTMGPGFGPMVQLIERVLPLIGERSGEQAVRALFESDTLFMEAIEQFLLVAVTAANGFDPNANIDENGIDMSLQLPSGDPVTEAHIQAAAQTLHTDVSAQVRGYAIQVAQLLAQRADSLEEALAQVGETARGLLPQGHTDAHLVSAVEAQAAILINA